MNKLTVAAPDLKRITALARKQIKLTKDLESLEERAKVKRELRDEIATRELPDMLAEVGIAELILRDGSKVVVKPNYYCGLTGKYKEPAIAWLRKKGFDDLISQVVGVSFGKGEDAEAKKVEKLLRDTGIPFKTEEVINSATFKALIRELIEKGERVPHNDLGVTIIDTAKITLPKPRRK